MEKILLKFVIVKTTPSQCDKRDSEQAITDAKYGFISGALRETYVDNHEDTARTTRVIDSIVTHRVWGYPYLFSVPVSDV